MYESTDLELLQFVLSSQAHTDVSFICCLDLQQRRCDIRVLHWLFIVTAVYQVGLSYLLLSLCVHCPRVPVCMCLCIS